MGVLLSSDVAHAVDEVEFVSGAKARGTLKSIDEDKRTISFEVRIGKRKYTRTYPFDRVRAITVDGKRREISGGSGASSGAKKSGTSAGGTKSRSEVTALIERVGKTPPDWFDATPLEYPQTLDLSWPLKPPTKGWNPQKNMGQYIWDVVNPNPRRWRSAVRLMHHEMSLHQNNRTLLRRDILTLAGMYFRLFQDYPRAAF